MEASGQLRTPGHFTTDESSPGTESLADWVGPTASLDILGKRFLHLPAVEALFAPAGYRNTIPLSSNLQPFLHRFFFKFFLCHEPCLLSKGGFRMLNCVLKRQRLLVKRFYWSKAYSKSSLECEAYMSILSSRVLGEEMWGSHDCVVRYTCCNAGQCSQKRTQIMPKLDLSDADTLAGGNRMWSVIDKASLSGGHWFTHGSSECTLRSCSCWHTQYRCCQISRYVDQTSLWDG
jgi:hypothetical protein